jgi:hypothetical protein
MYNVEIKHSNPAIGAKNKKATFSHEVDAVSQFEKWMKWLDARYDNATTAISADGYVITISTASTNDLDADYDTRN